MKRWHTTKTSSGAFDTSGMNSFSLICRNSPYLFLDSVSFSSCIRFSLHRRRVSRDGTERTAQAPAEPIRSQDSLVLVGILCKLIQLLDGLVCQLVLRVTKATSSEQV